MAASVFLVTIRMANAARQQAAEHYVQHSFETLRIADGVFAVESHVPVTTALTDIRDAASDGGAADAADILFIGTLARPYAGTLPPRAAQWVEERLPHIAGGGSGHY